MMVEVVVAFPKCAVLRLQNISFAATQYLNLHG